MVICIVVAVHYIASNQLTAIDVDVVLDEMETPSRRDTFVDVVKFLILFLVLVYTLGIIQ